MAADPSADSVATARGLAWWNALAEGVLLVEGGVVTDLNAAAAELFDVDVARARGAALISVVRDHRIEEVVRAGVPTVLQVRAKHVQIVPVEGALLLRDVTDQRRAEENARELLAVLSHELRTPVTSVRAVLDALSDDPSPELAVRFLPRAVAEADRLTRLLEDLTVDVKPPATRRLFAAEVVNRATQVLQPLLEQRGVTVTVHVPDRVVLADEDKLLQVIVNLLENAAVHGPPHELVEVVAWPEDRWLRIEVRDRGAPLDPAGVEQLFQPHSRGRRSGAAKGTGLGLYIVRSIASRWGGSAWGGPREPAPGQDDAEGADGGVAGNAFGVSVPLA